MMRLWWHTQLILLNGISRIFRRIAINYYSRLRASDLSWLLGTSVGRNSTVHVANLCLVCRSLCTFKGLWEHLTGRTSRASLDSTCGTKQNDLLYLCAPSRKHWPPIPKTSVKPREPRWPRTLTQLLSFHWDQASLVWPIEVNLIAQLMTFSTPSLPFTLSDWQDYAHHWYLECEILGAGGHYSSGVVLIANRLISTIQIGR